MQSSSWSQTKRNSISMDANTSQFRNATGAAVGGFVPLGPPADESIPGELFPKPRASRITILHEKKGMKGLRGPLFPNRVGLTTCQRGMKCVHNDLLQLYVLRYFLVSETFFRPRVKGSRGVEYGDESTPWNQATISIQKPMNALR